MSAVLGRAGAAGPSSLSRFRGALVGALLGDCVGAEFEGTEEVPLDRVLQHLDGLEEENRGDGESGAQQHNIALILVLRIEHC